MKKLLFILSAILVSVMGWAQNPYAYGLSCDLSVDEQILTINYSLNVKATSVQVEILDGSGNTCYTEQSAPANKGANSIKISTSSLPNETQLNWRVIVNGGNTGAQPTVPVWAVSKRPNAVHGVAVNNDQQSANFGKIYAAESMMTNATNDKWTWLNGNVPALLEYNQDLSFSAFHKKSKQNGTTVSNFSTSEPNRVRVSADGRIFVASYHSNSSTAVWEYTGSGNYNTIIPRTAGSNLRPTSIDVKGSGKDLKLLVTYYDNKVDETNKIAKVYCYEYPIGTSTSQYTAAGTLKAQYNDSKQGSTFGLLYQAVINNWNAYTVGMISAVYGDNNMIWMKIDFSVNQKIRSKVIAFNSSKTTPLKENDLPLSTNYYYGGDGIVVKGNLLVTGNNCAIHFYQTNTDGSITTKYNDLSTIHNNTIYTNVWINDLAIDHANNLYVVSAYAGNMMVVALPNGGKTTTKAPDRYKFKVPYPASNLQYAPVEGKNQYKFTFKVDATPRNVELRFYDTKEKMLKGGDDYAFQYSSFNAVAKGNMSVTFDAVKGTITDKGLNDPDGNGVLNLPPGEYYWCVCVNGTATPSSDNYCYIPERLSHDMDDTEMNLALETPKGLDLYRPFQGGMYNTICLPFNLDVKTLDSNHPYYNATVLAFDGATISTINDESVLELNFVSTDGVINHSTPYLIRPQSDISSGVRFDNITLQPVLEFPASEYLVNKNDINYLGVMGKGGFSFDPNEEIVLILVSDNRLAQLSSGGTINGFRGLFYFDKGVIPAGAVVKLAERKDTPTSLIDAQVKTIDIQKFLREGRVYIRVGETLYSIDGVKVE